jgi:hypothetical protein
MKTDIHPTYDENGVEVTPESAQRFTTEQVRSRGTRPAALPGEPALGTA